FARVFSRQGVAGEHKRPAPRTRVPSIYPSPCRFAPLTPPRAPAAGPSFRNITRPTGRWFRREGETAMLTQMVREENGFTLTQRVLHLGAESLTAVELMAVALADESNDTLDTLRQAYGDAGSIRALLE